MPMNKKIKIAIVVTSADAVRYHLPNILKRLPHDFEVIVVGSEVSQFKSFYPAIKWVDIYIERKIAPFSDLKALLLLIYFFISNRPDIVHSIMPKSGLLTSIAGFFCRVPVRIHTFTGQVWAMKSGVLPIILRAADKIVVLLNNYCLTDSPSQSNFLFEHKISKSSQPLPVLLKGSLSGVELERFDLTNLKDSATHLRAELGISEEDFIYSYIARKTRDKGAEDILLAFSLISKKIENVRLLFVGPYEDVEIEKIRKARPDLFNNVIDVDRVDNHEVYLAVTDVLCLPSYREGFGSIVIDAASMGIPTIGSSIPGLTDSIINHETGILFSLGNISELATQMEYLKNNTLIRRKMGSSAKARALEFFAADKLYSALKDFYLKSII
jgi:glycosyltransferase involved in cell wall biosynthesis